MTFSAGIASFPEDGASADALVKAADHRLYEAKHLGRNTVIGPSGPPPGVDIPLNAFPFASH